MLDFSHLNSQNGEVQFFVAATGNDYQTWNKPRGKTMGQILLVGNGGDGGVGAIGANSAAGGGGGGGSGAQCTVRFPLWAVPNTLYLSLGAGGTNGFASKVLVTPNTTANNVLVNASGGNRGNDAVGGTAGTGGAGGGANSAGTMPLGWQWLQNSIGGQTGSNGGSNGVASNLSLPVTGLIVTGGTGGAGVPGTGSTGFGSGSLIGAGRFPQLDGVSGAFTSTTPPKNGGHGFRPLSELMYFYGGVGGGSTHGDATGAGTIQSSGGNGALGCGGGGSGGALTGSTPGTYGKGGSAFCVITCW